MTMKAKMIMIAIAAMFTACSRETLPEVSGNMPLVFEVNEIGISKTKAATDGQYRTVFEEGDKMGVYAVLNGSLIDGFENRELVYDGHTWSFGTEIDYVKEWETAVFYAYFPYSETSEFNIAGQDPFAEKAASWEIPSDQSSIEAYVASDLMTGSGGIAEKNGKFTVTFNMKHRLGLLSVALPRSAYEFTNTDVVIKPYAYKKSENIHLNASIGGADAVEVHPYMDEDSHTLRLLVKPGTEISLNGTFDYCGEPKTLSIANDGISAGACSPYNVDGGYRYETMELKVGDYYCADGTLVSYSEDGPAPKNAIGVIYHIGTPEDIQSDLPHCSHALVYALSRENTVAGKFGESQPKTDGWFEQYGFTAADYSDTESLNGYRHTAQWLTVGGDNNAFCSLMQTSVANYRSAVALPANLTSVWFLPSCNEFAEMAANETVLNASLAKISAESVFEGSEGDDLTSSAGTGYWTSTLRRRDAVLAYHSTNTKDVREVGYLSSRDCFFRYAFAF